MYMQPFAGPLLIPTGILRLPILGELCLLSSAVCEPVKTEGQGYQDSEHTSKQTQI